jgi:hypothetical protein
MNSPEIGYDKEVEALKCMTPAWWLEVELSKGK